MTDQKESKTEGGFATGVVLGTLLGGASLFLLGTKTGRKIKQQLSEEYARGEFNLAEIHQKTNEKLEELIKHSPLARKLFDTISDQSSKLAAKPSVKSKKNFFSKKGKKLK